MNVTRKAIAERMKQGVDVVIEMLDARLPGSSANPLLAELTAHRPALKLLNKQDLADPARTALWLTHYNAQPATQALAFDASEAAPAARLLVACRALAPLRGGMTKPLRVLICGVPNVGKSTLVNTLVGKKAAHTGDEAGITKTEQRVALARDACLFDTPGMLWPKITVPQAGYHLAAAGSVGRNAYDEEEVALELLERLQPAYAPLIEARYRLRGVAAMPSEELLAAIARQRGAVQTGGRVNLAKAADLVLTDFRTGVLGRLTLETPDDFARWRAQAEAAEAERAARKGTPSVQPVVQRAVKRAIKRAVKRTVKPAASGGR
jgi:ribosome biogenesis GTPase A